MNYRRLASILGVAILGFGLVVMVSPGLAAFDPPSVLVWGVGGLVVLQALRVIQGRRHRDLDEAVTPDPELPTTSPSPGEDLQTVLEEFLDTWHTYLYRSRLRDGLRSAAVAVLTRYGGYSDADAEVALDAGTWTEDRFAAAFLGRGTALELPVRTRIRNWFRRESSMDRDVRHTVDAIATVAGVPPRSSEESADDAPRGGSPRADTRPDASRASVSPPRDAELADEAGDVVSRASHPTGHWRGVSVVALVGIGAGLLTGEPAVLLAGVVGIGFAAYARSAVLRPGSVSIERSLDADDPEPGEDVRVTVTVTNETDRHLPDLRLVDGVPETLIVTDGSPRHGTALRPGGHTTFTYTVEARRGVHTFGRTLLVARDLANAVEQERSLLAETALTCIPSLRPLTEPVPLRSRATRYVGRVETPDSGDGIEFYATREYRRGDALNRIDWNRRARTGELTTVEFHQERAATVVLVVDAIDAAYVSPGPDEPHAVDRAVDAAGGLYATLADSGDRVGITALSPEYCWLDPGTGVDHAVEARRLLATHPALSAVPRDGYSTNRWRRQLRERLSPGTQIVLLTPLCEEYSARFARQFEAYGYPVTVLSPDPTADRSPGHRLASVARRLRISALRSAGIPVVDWPRDRTVEEALARYNERWER